MSRLLANKITEFLDKHCPVLIHTPEISRLGDAAESVYYALLKARRDGKKVIIAHAPELFWIFRIRLACRELYYVKSPYCWAPGENFRRVCFDLLWNLLFGSFRIIYVAWRKFLRLLQAIFPGLRSWPASDFLISPLLGRATLWNTGGADRFSWDLVPLERWSREFEEFTPVTLAPKKLRRAERMRVQMGIPLGDWFACLHVREGGFYRDEAAGRASARNGAISNYIEGIKAITAAGGWVVRLGDPAMTPLPPMERVIDYAHSPFFSELMCLYLIQQCRFLVGTDAGPLAMGMRIFKKPVVITDLPGWTFFYPMRKGDLAILKPLFSRSRDRFLSVKERLEEPFTCQAGSFTELGEDYVLHNNASEEIRDVVEEFLRAPSGQAHSELQKAFNDGRKKQLARWLDDGILRDQPTPADKLDWRFRIAISCAYNGSLGSRFLQKNWHEDSRNVRLAKQEPVLKC